MMSRSTQWVGLTAAGEDFVSELERAPSDKHAVGMFNEMLSLGRWKIPEGVPFEKKGFHFPEHLCKSQKAQFVQEIVQEVPWSSGPMIFTRLEIEYHQGGVDDMFAAPCFEWIHDPNLQGTEFNQENGRIWV